MKYTENKDLLTIEEELTRMAEEVPEMPADFHASWMRALEEENMKNETKPEMTDLSNLKAPKKSFRWASLVSVAAALVLLVGGTLLNRDMLPGSKKIDPSSYTYNDTGSYGNSAPRAAAKMAGGSSSSYDSNAIMYSMEDAYEEASEASYDVAGASASVEAPRQQKIIRTVSLTLGTKTYDDLVASVRASCESSGGWVEYASESSAYSTGLRTVNMTLRIPAEKLDAFVESLSGEGRMIRRNESAYDVSDSYYDTKGRLATQQALMDRLRALVTDAASLSDLLALERQIAETQYQIDSLQGSLNGTDRQVNYATLDLTLKEETDASDVKNEELTFGQRLMASLKLGFESFGDFMEDLAVFTVSAIPVILLAAAVIILVTLIVRRVRRKNK